MQRRNDFTFDTYTVLRDVAKEWMTILFVAIAAFFLSFAVQAHNYQATYTMSTTFTVNSKGSYNSMYNDLSSASETASRFQQIINSSILQKKVAEDLELSSMPGQISASTVESTNLMTLTVTENDPQLAYEVMNSIMNNYSMLSENVIGDVILSVLQPAEIPEEPDQAFYPWKKMVYSFVAAIVLMILLLALISTFRDTVRKEKEVEQKLDTSLLGTLYHENKRRARKGLKGKKKRKSSILLTNPAISFQYVESMKKIAARVSNKMDKRHAKIVMVTSVGENEGKSTVAANLALALSEENKRVLLVDADLRKPAQYKIFDVDPKRISSLGEVLNRETAPGNRLIYRKPGTSLRMFLNTKAYENSTEILSNGIFNKMLQSLQRSLDYIIVDSTPMNLVADSEEILPMMDAVLVVVKQHTANVRDINDAIDILNEDGGKLLGCVFNDLGGNSHGTHGYYGYDSYGNYGKGYGYGKRYGYGYGRYAKDDPNAYDIEFREEGEDE